MTNMMRSLAEALEAIDYLEKSISLDSNYTDRDRSESLSISIVSIYLSYLY